VIDKEALKEDIGRDREEQLKKGVDLVEDENEVRRDTTIL
jgi:hypothetical protein